MRIFGLFFSIFLLQSLFAGVVNGKEEFAQVQVFDPYIELHTGPGRGYPVFHVVERDEWVYILKRKTDWFKVRTEKGVAGWVNRSQMLLTLSPKGERTDFDDPEFGDFSSRRWEMGVSGGDLEGARLLSAYAGFSFNQNLSSEISVGQALGNFSTSYLVNLNIVAQPFPEWRVSPYFTIGTGGIHTKPRVTLVQPLDTTDATAHVGVGVRAYLTRRFMLRASYRNYVVFTSKDENEEINEWQAGFAFFF